MCFNIEKNSRNFEPKIAKRDIVCYKIGFETLNSDEFIPFFKRTYVYRFGVLQPKVTLHPAYTGGYGPFIDEGYHSISNKKDCRLLRTSLFGANTTDQTTPVVAVKCIIPKGTEYYYNSQEKEYVSETIIVQDFIKP